MKKKNQKQFQDTLFYDSTDEVPRLFHLSLNPGITHLIPLIPDCTMAPGKEDYWSRRICLAPSIKQCLTALDTNNFEDNDHAPYYVYTPDLSQLSLADIMKTTIHMVRDANVTDEHWIIKEVDMKRIGKIVNYHKIGERKYAYTGLGKVGYHEYEYEFIELK